ncbi:MAG TPA: type IV pilus assembly protein PilM, partial [Patescibacteria group bacterium]|nr:type IV pilus assembly protein PilM [Patescibacteria group bacterium]
LVTYAYVNLPAESLDKSLLTDVPGTVDLLKKMLEKARVTTKKTISALPISSVFSSILSVPTVDEKELKTVVTNQAKKLIPLPIEEVALDLKVIDKTEKKEEGKPATRVLVTAAPKTLVNQYVDIFKQAGLELISLETEAFAHIRSLIGKDRSTIMVVDIGSLRTNILVVENGIPFVIRSIATGGNAITQTIAKTLGIPVEQAESMKRDIHSMQSFAPAGDLTPILSVLLKPILDEIRYSFNLYQTQESARGPKRIDKIILTGGSSLLPRLPEFLTQQVNVNTYLGNPWARIVYPPDLRPVLEELGPRFAVPIGCAMRDIDS